MLSVSDPYCAPWITLLSTCNFKGLLSTQESLKMQPLAMECHCQNRRWTHCIFGQTQSPKAMPLMGRTATLHRYHSPIG